MATPNAYPYSDAIHQDGTTVYNEEEEQYSKLQHNIEISKKTTGSEYNTLHHNNMAASNVLAPSNYSSQKHTTTANGSSNNLDYSTQKGQLTQQMIVIIVVKY